MIDKNDGEYFYNWYEEFNLECKSRSSYAIIASIYFIGYGLGVIFYWMPDKYGRKGTMWIVLPG